jgi:hypothetical protein
MAQEVPRVSSEELSWPKYLQRHWIQFCCYGHNLTNYSSVIFILPSNLFMRIFLSCLPVQFLDIDAYSDLYKVAISALFN